MAAINGILEVLDQLPLQQLDAGLLASLEEARRRQDPDKLGLLVRRAVAELLLTGDLVRVAVASSRRNGGDLMLIHGTSRLVDCTALPRLAREAAAGTNAEAAQDTTDPAPTTSALTVPRFDVVEMLDAMELAQDLSVGDPRADDPNVVINRILTLLKPYLPDSTLHAQLTVVEGDSEAYGLVVPPPELSAMPFWLRHRRLGQSLWVPRTEELPRELDERLGLAPGEDRATAVVPLLAPDEADGESGLLYLTVPESADPAATLKLARRLSRFVTRRWRCQRDVNRRVLTDSLTGIHNRAFFDTQFPLELERVRRSNQPLTLVIADLDHFKTINDTFGHQCGDLALRSVARQLLSALRRIDVICRIGGEEFACILPATSDEEAREVLTRFVGRPFRVNLPPELGVGTLSVTLSYGAVTFPQAGASAGELHRKADALLYQAKERGRNRCCQWTPSGITELS